MPRDFGPGDFGPGEFDPLDLEPVDLEPVDLEPADDETRFERPRRGSSGRIWIAIAGAAIVAGAVVVLTHRGTHARPAATPAPTNEPTTSTATSTTVLPPVNHIIYVAPALQSELRAVGSGRFAAIVDDRLYVIDATTPSMTLVPLPEGHVTIDDQNGSSLLVSTFEQTLVSTQPISTRTLSARDFAIKAKDPAQWWLLRDDGTVRIYDGAGQPVPDGLRPVAALQDGFVALDTHSAWVVWSRSGIRPIAHVGDQLLATQTHTIAFKSDCGYSGCSLHLLDLADGTLTSTGISQIPEFAAFSPDGTRLAVATTTGGVFVVNTATGEIVTGTRALSSSSPSLPFTWTPDSRELLVVQDHAVEFRRASDGRVTKVVSGTDGLEQLVALP
jgi:WD40 repeat protein